MLIQVPAATKIVGLIMAGIMMMSGLNNISDNNKSVVYKNDGYYEIIDETSKSTIYTYVDIQENPSEHTMDWLDGVVVFRKDGEVLNWEESGMGRHTEDSIPMYELYESLDEEEKAIFDRRMDSMNTVEKYKSFLKDIKKQATKTKINERWFNK